MVVRIGIVPAFMRERELIKSLPGGACGGCPTPGLNLGTDIALSSDW